MDLHICESLTEVPDLSGMPNLIELRLYRCESLTEVHPSIGSLDKFEILNLEDCTGLQDFPKFTGKLDSLRELNLSGTRVKLDSLIDDEKQLLRNLEILNLTFCS